MTGLGDTVPTFLGLLMVATLVAALVRQTRFPYEVALVLVGLALALVPGVPHAEITPRVILTVFLPILLFHGAYNLSLRELRASLPLVAFLALPGVVFTSAIVGVALHLLAAFPWTTALLFGTIVGATDPVSVLAVFGRVGAPRRLTTIVSGESLLNDGTALVLFSVVLGIATGGQFSIAGGAVQLLVMLAGSMVLGGAIGLAGAQALRHVDDALVEISLTVIIAYGGYLLAAALGISGPLATVAAGVLFGTRGEQVMSPATRLQASAVWEFLDFLTNSLLFLLMGLAVRGAAVAPGGRLGSALLIPLLIALPTVVLSRVVVVLLTRSLFAAARRPLPRGWTPVLVWAGLRGAVSLAAALSLPPRLADRDLLVLLTFGTVLFTLLAQGLTIAPLLGWLGLGRAPTRATPPGTPHDRTYAQVLTDEDLAYRLGITVATLALLRRIPMLDADRPVDPQLVTALAVLTKVDAALLAQLLPIWQTEGLSWALRTYRQRHALSNADLALYLQMPESKLDVLYHSPYPNPSRSGYDRRIARLAEAADCNVDRLAAMLADVARQSEEQAPESTPLPTQESPWASES